MARFRNHGHPIQASYHIVLSGHSPLFSIASTSFLISGCSSKNSSICEQKQKITISNNYNSNINNNNDSDNDQIQIDLSTYLVSTTSLDMPLSPPKCGIEV